VAAASLHLAKKMVLQDEMKQPNFKSCEIDKTSQYLDETMKILGYDCNCLKEIFTEIAECSALQ
jgi:hypothetical protein